MLICDHSKFSMDLSVTHAGLSHGRTLNPKDAGQASFHKVIEKVRFVGSSL